MVALATVAILNAFQTASLTHSLFFFAKIANQSTSMWIANAKGVESGQAMCPLVRT
jgi:hypothetical protein